MPDKQKKMVVTIVLGRKLLYQKASTDTDLLERDVWNYMGTHDNQALVRGFTYKHVLDGNIHRPLSEIQEDYAHVLFHNMNVAFHYDQLEEFD